MSGNLWRERSAFWSAESAESAPARKHRERSKHTLIITGHGASLRIAAGTLLIRNGFTHYPQQREEFRYFRGDLERPAQIVILDGSGSISFDVIDWLAEQEIPVIRVNWQGEVTAVIGGSGLKFDAAKVRWQERTRESNSDRIAFCRSLIASKIENSISTLQACIPGPKSDSATEALENHLNAIRRATLRNVDDVRAIEGPAAFTYFRALAGTPLRWRTIKRRPIPVSWNSLVLRSSIRDVKIPRNSRATHPLNAMLNYGYAVLLGQLRIRNAAEGCDPNIGIMHNTHKGSPAYLLDLMEPLRPIVDRAILQFTLGQDLHPADFIIRADGAVRLNPQLARRVVDLIVRRVSPLDGSLKLTAGRGSPSDATFIPPAMIRRRSPRRPP